MYCIGVLFRGGGGGRLHYKINVDLVMMIVAVHASLKICKQKSVTCFGCIFISGAKTGAAALTLACSFPGWTHSALGISFSF